MIDFDLLKSSLKNTDKKVVIESDALMIPEHFHVTQISRIESKSIDCGGTVRQEKFCLIQLWVATDVDHRLSSKKMLDICSRAAEHVDLVDLPVRIEYGENAAATYRLTGLQKQTDCVRLVLEPVKTTCLAPDKCGVEGC